MYRRLIGFAICFLLTFGLITCSRSNELIVGTSTTESETSHLTIWWTQGFLPEENAAVAQLIADWEAISGYQADLILLPDGDILQDAFKATEEGRAPDILFSFAADTNLIPKLAWQDKLADVSDLLRPFRDRYFPTALKSVHYFNQVTRQRSDYAIPFGQNTVHLHYWHDMLLAAGYREDDIPQQWNRFWKFWQDVQDKLRDQNQKIYGLGLTISDLGTDTFWVFEQFLQAYGIQLVDENGNLILDQAETRHKIINAIQQFASFYRTEHIPPLASTWKDSGNNASFLNRESLMTANSTLSIPFSQRQPDNPYNQQSRNLYYNKIRTIAWPNASNGEVLSSILSIKQAVMFKDTNQPEAARSFLEYLMQPANTLKFLQANKGRIFPVMPELLKNVLWSAQNDPHLAVALEQYEGLTRPAYQVYAAPYSQVMQENVWAKAILHVAKNDMPVEKAADEAIARVKAIFEEWQ